MAANALVPWLARGSGARPAVPRCRCCVARLLAQTVCQRKLGWEVSNLALFSLRLTCVVLLALSYKGRCLPICQEQLQALKLFMKGSLPSVRRRVLSAYFCGPLRFVMGKKILSKEVELEHILPRKASSVLLWGEQTPRICFTNKWLCSCFGLCGFFYLVP